MGVNSANLRQYIQWADEGWLKAGSSILELGAQELFCVHDPAALNEFLARFGGTTYLNSEAERMADGGMVGDLMQRAGFAYTSIDFKPFPHCVRLDLNVDTLPAEYHGRYGLVTNHGTSEHILNQWNVFKTVHDATAVEGIMFHMLPMTGKFEHGIVNYNAKFFWALGEANGYRRIRMSVRTPKAELAEMPREFETTITLEPGEMRPQATNTSMAVLFQKTRDSAFAGLVDPAFA